ncbi:MAG: preprotein translocase subunit YajC [Hyphomicrobiaceae bacterium]|nr:MAG: preprotein translocase subunit YajC [Hyphomicrobiaceae bacterium]
MQGSNDFLVTIAPLFIILAIMYLLVFRPQQRRMKEAQEMIANIKRGDRVVMSGGLLGKVTKVVDDRELELEIADGVRVRVSRPSVAEVRVKGEPQRTESKGKSEDGKSDEKAKA